MYKHILLAVAFDTDHDADQSLRVAKMLSAPDTRVSVLHVKEAVPDYITTYVPEDYDAKLNEELQSKLSALAAQFDHGVPVLVNGHSGRTIVDWADTHDVDCIIIASHQPGLQDYLLGSTAARVVRHAKCAVHVLR